MCPSYSSSEMASHRFGVCSLNITDWSHIGFWSLPRLSESTPAFRVSSIVVSLLRRAGSNRCVPRQVRASVVRHKIIELEVTIAQRQNTGSAPNLSMNSKRLRCTYFVARRSRRPSTRADLPTKTHYRREPCFNIVLACSSTASVTRRPDSMRASSVARCRSVARYCTEAKVRPPHSVFSTE
jgi:hypothetical protein